jgi:arylsulfatase A-like enzyme
VVEKLLEWKDEIDRAERSFVYLNFMDPHWFYHKRSGWFPPDEPGLDQPLVEKAELETFVKAYDSEIRYLDDQIRRLFESFGWRKDALVVFTADHGEEFMEHGNLGHGRSLHQESVHVPLFFFVPDARVRPRSVGRNVSLVDVLPTLRDLLGMERRSHYGGVSLAPLIFGQDQPELAGRPLFGHLQRRKSDLTAEIHDRYLVRGQWKYILRRGEPHEMLFHVHADPGEKKDLFSEQSDRARDMRAALEALEVALGRASSETVEIPATPELIEQLEALGYVR